MNMQTPSESALRRRLARKISRESDGRRRFAVARGREREVAKYLVLEGNMIVGGMDDLAEMAKVFGVLPEALVGQQQITLDDGLVFSIEVRRQTLHATLSTETTRAMGFVRWPDYFFGPTFTPEVKLATKRVCDWLFAHAAEIQAKRVKISATTSRSVRAHGLGKTHCFANIKV